MKILKSILILSILILSSTLIAQVDGTIKGTVLDEKNAPMPFTPVAILQDSTHFKSVETDVNGEFTVKNLTPGKYNIKTFATSYNTHLLEKVIVKPNQIVYVNIKMTLSATALKAVVVTEKFREPLVDPQFVSLTSIDIEQIENSAVGKSDIIGLIVMVTPAVLQTNDGKDIYVRGSRRGSTTYYVDGNKTMSVPSVPGMGIGGMEILTGGIPADYGDCTGGVVVITTKEYKWEMSRKQNKIDERKERAIASQEKKTEDVEYEMMD